MRNGRAGGGNGVFGSKRRRKLATWAEQEQENEEEDENEEEANARSSLPTARSSYPAGGGRTTGLGR